MAQAENQSTPISDEMQALIDEVVEARHDVKTRFEGKKESNAKTDALIRVTRAEKALRGQSPTSLADLAAKVCAIVGDREGEREYTFSADDANWLARDILNVADNGEDPLIAIGKQIEELGCRHDDTEGLVRGASESDSSGYQADLEHLFDRQLILADYASTLEARTLEGALVQLGCMGAVVDRALRSTGERARDHRSFDRMLHSVLTALQRIEPEHVAPLDLDLTQLGIFRLVSEFGNPWLPYDRRAAMLASWEHRESGNRTALIPRRSGK